jgi:hypothetical protein
LLNYYALQKYNVGDRNVSASFLGSNLIESVMQAIFMVEAAGNLLGNCFIEYQGSTNSKSLLEIIEEETALGKAVSMPIILMFPNNTIYTVDLLEKIFNEFSKSAEGVINQKYLADYSPVRS